MEGIYEKVKTPYKYGIVLKGEKGEKVDCPSVFRYGDKWYMMYIIYGGRGYETAIAESEDLLHWEKIGKIMHFKKNGWDANQAAGFIGLQEYEWNGSYKLNKYDGKYWLFYIGGKTKGYEKGKLSIGIAWTKQPTVAKPWTRLENNPVLSPDQSDARGIEDKKLYKSNIILDESESLGFP